MSMPKGRTPLIAGNWKMNPASRDEAIALAEAVKAGVGQEAEVHVVVCPPAVFLHEVDVALANSPVGLGGQDMHEAASGAFTGSLSGAMLLDAGCTHVILGHSERRHLLGETDAMVNAKLRAALTAKILPIVCLGELLEERQAGRTEEVVASQLDGSLAGIEPGKMAGIVVAYEPVWAIGTGHVATPEQAQEVHAFLRGRLADRFGRAIADRVIIQYGGSVKPENAAELMACPDVDGALVGGASLKAADFLGIVAASRPAGS